MKCLAIPNTKHFQGITSIADAYALNTKIQQEAQATFVKPDAVVEYEDSEGTPLTRKVYEDMKRQGLL